VVWPDSVHYLNGLRSTTIATAAGSGIYSVQIGRHDSRDRAAIEEIVGALAKATGSRSITGAGVTRFPADTEKEFGRDIVIDVAKYFMKRGESLGRATTGDSTFSHARFCTELPRVLGKYGVTLPDCELLMAGHAAREQLNREPHGHIACLQRHCIS